MFKILSQKLSKYFQFVEESNKKWNKELAKNLYDILNPS